MAKIHPSDSTSAFQWYRLILNLSASTDYNPSKLCAKLILHDGCIAVGCIDFFDDGRIYAPGN